MTIRQATLLHKIGFDVPANDGEVHVELTDRVLLVYVLLVALMCATLCGVACAHETDAATIQPTLRDVVYAPEVKDEAPVYDEWAPTLIRATAYHDEIMCDGSKGRDGVIAAASWLYGYTAILWEVNEDGSRGDLIGYYEVKDTGAGIDTDGDGYGDSIRNGQSIDVWVPSEAAVWTWVAEHGDYVYVYFVKGVG